MKDSAFTYLKNNQDQISNILRVSAKYQETAEGVARNEGLEEDSTKFRARVSKFLFDRAVERLSIWGIDEIEGIEDGVALTIVHREDFEDFQKYVADFS